MVNPFLRRFLISAVSVLFVSRCFAEAPAKGVVALTDESLQPGATMSLVGEWLYKPTYALAADEKPEIAGDNDANSGYVPLRVPQFLNRVRWWLDDSDDFNKHEDARLKALGFDTDKADEGWYRLWIDAPKLVAGQHVMIDFEGIAMKSRVFLNGNRVAEHDGMFSRINCDLTPHLKPGRNLLAVWVSMEKLPTSTVTMGQAVSVNLTESKVKSMSKGMFGPLSPGHENRAYDLHGIWQPVRLHVTSGAKIYDVFFKPKLDSADVLVEARALSTSSSARLRAEWFDQKTGEKFATAEPKLIELSGASPSTTLTVTGIQPKPWSPSDPNLYRLDVTLESIDGKLLDKWSQKVGFRTFEIRGNQLYLNGHRYWLRGANHLPYGKNPWDPQLARKLIQQMHDCNIRITRTHCTPWNEDWLTAADEIGLGVSLEGIRPWAFAGKVGATPPHLFQHWLMENEDVIRRCRNHPSVLIYTIGNELLLRDHENVEKWKQLSEVVKQTRQVDPTLPTVSSSSYEREGKLYNRVLAPNNIDDGDIDDLHSYKGWYAVSSFVSPVKHDRDAEQKKWIRPLIGQEYSTGYPDLDGGIPTLKYLDQLITPQAWIGVDAYNNAASHLEHNRAATKHWAEQLRYQRGDVTAGFMMFATECWFYHPFDVKTLKPYPVFEAMRDAFAPVGLALETGRRRFFSGEEIQTAVFITNDDEQYRDFDQLEVHVDFVDADAKPISTAKLAAVASLPYYATVNVPVKLTVPSASQRQAVTAFIRLMKGTEEISRTSEPVDIFPSSRQVAAKSKNGSYAAKAACYTLGLEPELSQFIATVRFKSYGTSLPATADNNTVIFLGEKTSVDALTTGTELRKLVDAGATAIVLHHSKEVATMFADQVLSSTKETGEFADFMPVENTAFTKNLKRTDLKWWGRKNDWRVFVNSAAYRLQPHATARELIRFIPQHGYTAPERIPPMYRTAMFEIKSGKGRIWFCTLDLEQCVNHDPAARQFTENLLTAAADPQSTTNLPPIPTHEELLAGRSGKGR